MRRRTLVCTVCCAGWNNDQSGPPGSCPRCGEKLQERGSFAVLPIRSTSPTGGSKRETSS